MESTKAVADVKIELASEKRFTCAGGPGVPDKSGMSGAIEEEDCRPNQLGTTSAKLLVAKGVL